VIVQHIGSRPFGERSTEHEFIVIERIFGNAADRIFVYTERHNAEVSGVDRPIYYRPGDVTFEVGTTYILPLWGRTSVYGKTHEDGFALRADTVIDLDDLSNSVMWTESLFLHTDFFDSFTHLNNDHVRDELIAYIKEWTKDNSFDMEEYIKSEETEDIIHGSPYVLVVEVNEPRRLVHEQIIRDWMETDLYYVTVVHALKGDLDVGVILDVTFFADTVYTGEQHIVALAQRRQGGFYDFSSRNSLFSMDQLDDIMWIIEQGADDDYDDPGDGDDPIETPLPTPEPTPQPTPTPSPEPTPSPTPSPTPQPGPMFSLNTFNQLTQFRVWTQLDSVSTAVPIPWDGAPLPSRGSPNISAVDQEGNDAMPFVRINFVGNRPQDGMVNYIDVLKSATTDGTTATWQTIVLTVISEDRTVEITLTNN